MKTKTGRKEKPSAKKRASSLRNLIKARAANKLRFAKLKKGKNIIPFHTATPQPVCEVTILVKDGKVKVFDFELNELKYKVVKVR